MGSRQLNPFRRAINCEQFGEPVRVDHPDGSATLFTCPPSESFLARIRREGGADLEYFLGGTAVTDIEYKEGEQ